jgi:hypothetical protein
VLKQTNMTRATFWILISVSVAAGGQIPSSRQEAVLQIEVENAVYYVYDSGTPQSFATDPGRTIARPGRNFSHITAVGDVTAVNGSPARGTWWARLRVVLGDPNPQPGQMITDVNRCGVWDWIFEILPPEGESVGTIVATGLNCGPAPPGAPAAHRVVNMAVTGGTGAYVGVRGQAGLVSVDWARAGGPASVTQDPSSRRHDSGGRQVHIVQLTDFSSPRS